LALPTLTKNTATVYPDSTTIVPSEVRQLGLEIETFLNSLAGRTPLIGGYWTASGAANVLTIAVKTYADADPSAADPVYIDFPSQTASDGKSTRRTISAALQLVISAGSTLGFANGIPGRVWAEAFDDAGTVRLAAYNAYGGNTAGAGGTLFPFNPSMVASSTAEGGAGAADSAGVFYTGTAVAAKPFVVLGYAAWETALATAGLWSANPDVVHQQRLGDPKPGDVIQVADSVDGAQANGATTTPADDTIPQSTEGNQFMTKAITPASKANVLDIAHAGQYSASAAAQIIVALFQDATANALAVRAQKCTALSDLHAITVDYRMIAATVAATTFKVRAGGSAASTITFNGAASARLFGGTSYSRLSIRELMG
jgi:hypothetical protein